MDLTLLRAWRAWKYHSEHKRYKLNRGCVDSWVLADHIRERLCEIAESKCMGAEKGIVCLSLADRLLEFGAAEFAHCWALLKVD